MTGTDGQGPTEQDTLTNAIRYKDAAPLFDHYQASISDRSFSRYCKRGYLDGYQHPGTLDNDPWFATLQSIHRRINELRGGQQLPQVEQSDFVRQWRVLSDNPTPETGDISETTSSSSTDGDRHHSPTPDKQHSKTPEDEPATGGQPAPAMTSEEGLYNHPYVKRLEAQAEKWERKYDDQVRRTEEIQTEARKEIVNLQQAVAIGQSQVYADFLLGQGSADKLVNLKVNHAPREGSADAEDV